MTRNVLTHILSFLPCRHIAQLGPVSIALRDSGRHAPLWRIVDFAGATRVPAKAVVRILHLVGPAIERLTLNDGLHPRFRVGALAAGLHHCARLRMVSLVGMNPRTTRGILDLLLSLARLRRPVQVRLESRHLVTDTGVVMLEALDTVRRYCLRSVPEPWRLSIHVIDDHPSRAGVPWLYGKCQHCLGWHTGPRSCWNPFLDRLLRS